MHARPAKDDICPPLATLSLLLTLPTEPKKGESESKGARCQKFRRGLAGDEALHPSGQQGGERVQRARSLPTLLDETIKYAHHIAISVNYRLGSR